MLVALLNNPRSLKVAPQVLPNYGYTRSGFLRTRRPATTEGMKEAYDDHMAAWLPSGRHQDHLFLAIAGITAHIPCSTPLDRRGHVYASAKCKYRVPDGRLSTSVDSCKWMRKVSGWCTVVHLV